MLISTFWVRWYSSSELIKSKSGDVVSHFSFFNFYFDFIDIANCLEGTIESHVLFIPISFLGLDCIISKILHTFTVISCILLRVRTNWISIMTRVQILRFHQTSFHFNFFESLLDDDEFLLGLLEVFNICTLVSFLSGWNSLANL